MKTLAGKCENCGLRSAIDVAVCRVIVDPVGVLVIWPCVDCGAGWLRPVTMADASNVLSSGAHLSPEARRLAAGLRDGPTLLAIPPVRDVPLRRAPLSRLARMVNRRNDEGEER